MTFRTRLSSQRLAATVMAITSAVIVIIVAGIVLVLLGANSHNVLASGIHDVGAWFVTPFHDLFPRRQPKQDVLLNWGIGALAYLVVGGAIARLVR